MLSWVESRDPSLTWEHRMPWPEWQCKSRPWTSKRSPLLSRLPRRRPQGLLDPGSHHREHHGLWRKRLLLRSTLVQLWHFVQIAGPDRETKVLWTCFHKEFYSQILLITRFSHYNLGLNCFRPSWMTQAPIHPKGRVFSIVRDISFLLQAHISHR